MKLSVKIITNKNQSNINHYIVVNNGSPSWVMIII
jgi:hypothetical protein